MPDDSNSREKQIINWTLSYFKDTPDMIFLKDLDLRYIAASRPFTNMLGLSDPSRVVGRTDYELFADQGLAQRYVDDDRRMIESGKPLTPFVEPLPQKNGLPAWSLTHKGFITDEKGRITGVFGISVDITEKTELEQNRTRLEAENRVIRTAMTELRAAAETDGLTHLLNQGATADKIKEYLAGEGRHGRHALLLIDLDNFKAANDQFGHQRGDEVLTDIAGRISGVFRATDIIGRFGGDEFFVLMKDIPSLGVVRAKAAELISATQVSVVNGDLLVNISSSVGIGIYEGSGSYEELYSEVDAALSSAKTLGKNRYFIWKDTELDAAASAFGEDTPREKLSASVVSRWHSVLIADDDSISRAMLKKVLERNYSVELASDGAEAMEKLRGGNFSLLITDIQMPRMTGWDVLAAMQKSPALRDTPVIVITADDQPESEIRALNLGATDVIVKPFVPVVLLSRVQNTIARQEVRQKEEQNRLYEVRLQEQEKLLRLAEQDELTGLYNRKAFVRKAAAIISKYPAGHFVISCLNVDSFKMINDRYGHAEGDRLLRFIASGAHRTLNGAELLLCRDVADVFITLLPNDPALLAETEKNIQTFIQSFDLPTSISVSLGRYAVTEPELDVNLMIDRAKMAAGTVSGSAHSHVAWYNASMRDIMLREKELTDQMRSSLDAGQFEVWFQPQYEYPAGSVYGAEALVRWRHPGMGLVSPSEFIPLFEKNGFIYDLDRYVWRQCCRVIRDWSALGITLPPISVNVSRADLYDPELADGLVALTAEFGLAPQDLRLEITERDCMNDPEQLIVAIVKLRKRGFMVEMDDFGSGYSSLNTIKDVPVDVIKLDMRFLSSGESSENSKRILSVIVQLADALHCDLIAEGVETVSQADLLRSLGCRFMQGYYFSKPLPEEDFRKAIE